MSIAQRIKENREARNMSQSVLAELIGTTKQTIYKYENEIVTNIPLDKLEKIASAFDMRVVDLLGVESEGLDAPTAGLLSTRYNELNAENKEIIDRMIEKLIKSQSDD